MGLRPPFGGDQSYVGRLKHCCSQVAFFPLFGSHHLETTGSMMQHVTSCFHVCSCSWNNSLNYTTLLPRSFQSLQPQGQAKMTKLPTPPVAWVEHLGHPSAQRYLASHHNDHGPRATLNRMLCTSRRLGVENGIHNGQSHVVALASGTHLSPQKSGLNSGLDDLPSCRWIIYEFEMFEDSLRIFLDRHCHSTVLRGPTTHFLPNISILQKQPHWPGASYDFNSFSSHPRNGVSWTHHNTSIHGRHGLYQAWNAMFHSPISPALSCMRVGLCEIQAAYLFNSRRENGIGR